MRTEPGVRFFVPQHRGAALVTIENFSAPVNQGLRNPPMLNGNRVFSLFKRNSYPGYPDLIPKIGKGNASASKLKKCQQFCLCDTTAQPADDSCAVMIGEDEGGYQRFGKMFFERHQHLTKAFRPERG